MTQEKKRPSKRAKAVAKLLQNSELLAAKKANEAKADFDFNPADVSVKTSPPNKMRPEKKRG